MPPLAHYPVQEILMRYGIVPNVAKNVSMRELRYWSLKDLKQIFEKMRRDPKRFCPFEDPERFMRQWRQKQDTNDQIRSVWPSFFETSSAWLAPPRSLMVEAADEKAALCINARGEFSVRHSDYMAISHAWIEGLQQDRQKRAVRGDKIDLIFKTLAKAKIEAKWIWTDVLAIPGGGGPTDNLDDDLLKTRIINSLSDIYKNAEGIVIFDAMVWQLQTLDPLELAAVVVCGQWASRVWTYQEVKLARKAIIINGWYHAIPFAYVTNLLKIAAEEDPKKYKELWLSFQIMSRENGVDICVTDVSSACLNRVSGQDVDYARAFFPIFGLEWANGMTREEGLHILLWSHTGDVTRMIFSYGQPRLKKRPAWAPSNLTGLATLFTKALAIEERGVRGDLWIAKISSTKSRFSRLGRTALTLAVDDGQFQCELVPAESEETIKNLKRAIDLGRAFLISPMRDYPHLGTPCPVLLVEKADVAEYDGFEAAVHCTALLVTRTDFKESKISVLLRHASPLDDDLDNQLQYMWYTQREQSIPAQLRAQAGESLFHAAVRKGDLQAIEALFNDGHSAEVHDGRGWTPLHTAAARGQNDILRCLVHHAKIIDVPGQRMSKDTPLGLAAEYDQAEAITILHDAGANIEVRNDSDNTPLMLASLEGCVSAVKTLIDLHADANAHNKLESALFLLCGRTNKAEARLKILNILLANDADPDGHNHLSGWTPLHKAAEWSEEAIVSTLLAHRANVNARMYETNYTPLRIAIIKNRPEIVRILLNAGADRNTGFQGGWTPTHLAAQCPDFKIMRMLLEDKGVELNGKLAERGWTPLHLAARMRHGVIVKLLLEAGADWSLTTDAGLTPLELVEEIGAGDVADTIRHFVGKKEGDGRR